eukprot:TRINITY_DN145_c0_g1_i1.p1 TRINITY_DN145_c0_g1~~TRINITY_DN145_c0_g1_i1.p1  ORF type:complete len:2180 (+),score=716.66 TRINITY_DN145_c0_g1_i1:39-6578(+)
MAEVAAHFRQSENRANSSIVITSDTARPRSNEPTGEPETLAGRVSKAKMGDRVQYTKPADMLEQERKARVVRQRDKPKMKREHKAKKLKVAGPKNVLQATEELEQGVYRPKTRETKLEYEKLLTFMQEALGDQPQDVLRGAADETLAVMKNDKKSQPERKVELEKGLFDSLSEDQFAELTRLCKNITDYAEEEQQQQLDNTIDEETGVAVVFDEEEEGDEDEDQSDEERVVQDDAEMDEDIGEDTAVALQTDEKGTEIVDELVDAPASALELDPSDIDAFWVQRKVREFEQDAVAAQALAEKTLASLKESDQRLMETQLVGLLGYDKFAFIKLLLHNHVKILYCIRLAKAENEAERKQIEEEMAADPAASRILQHLRQGPAKETETEEDKAEDEKPTAEEEAQKQRKVIDLDTIAFAGSGHYMSNKQCILPKGSFRTQKQGYEEIHVPKPTFPAGEKATRTPIATLPLWIQPFFPNTTHLTVIQSKLFEAAFYKADNLLLCAPTGSGKTNVALLCMLHEIGLHMDKEGHVDRDAFKIIYVAPMKSLVQEMVGNFSARLESLGIVVRELSGDVNLTKQEIAETQVIVTTPEKWDIVTRKSGDRSYTQLVKLIILDEIHLLHDSRGPVLESLVARTIRQIEQTQEMVRIVGLSATLPNYEDVGTFLRVDAKNVFAFTNEYRPAPLEQSYIGITEKKALKRFQLMNEITYEKVIERAGVHQVLIFVHSRKETGKTARAIRDMAVAQETITKFLATKSASRGVLQEMCKTTANAELRDLLPYGFAIHNAGMLREDRRLVEELFADKHIQVLVSTATLAWGVNLPAHTIIIKGTQIYNPERGKWMELSPLDIMQMIGRAGRPQYDSEGEGIVLTSHSELQYYLSLLNHQLPIESQFVSRLVDSLNAEIVMGNVQNVSEAVLWLRYTYLYIRMLRNPELYQISPDQVIADPTLEQRRADLVHSAATVLDRNNLIVYDRKSGAFQSTDLGRVASHYYVAYGSIAVYNEHLKPAMSDIELFRLFSLSQEFRFIPVREEEKKELEKLLDRVPIPIKESLEEPTAKVNVLLQAHISRLRLEGFALMSDMVYVTQSAARICRALHEIVLKRGWAQAAEKALNLCKMVERRQWISQSPLRQFGALPEDIVRKIEKNDYPFQRLYDLNSQELGELIKMPAQGKMLHRFVHTFPKLDLAVSVQPVTRSMLCVELVVTADFTFDPQYHGNALAFWVLVEDVDGETILHHEYFLLKRKYAQDEHLLSFFVPITEPLPPQYFVRVLSDRWLGAETTVPVSFRHLILPEKYPPHTELLDLQPLRATALEEPDFVAFYGEETFFNPIQTQIFDTLYKSDENCLVCAPTASGKSVCAEFAVLRAIRQAGKGVRAGVVYLAPVEAVAKQRASKWRATLGKQLGRSVVELTGEAAVDLKLLERSDIVVTTPERWDVLSRRWKQRKAVQAVRLLVVDDLHMVGAEGGDVLEVVVSRMRYIASQQQAGAADAGGSAAAVAAAAATKPTLRIVGLSTSLANARDLGGWIGAAPKAIFNFHPNVRPLPLEIHLQGYDNSNFEARMQAMAKPVLQAVRRHAAGRPCIVFVPSKKQAHVTARDLAAFADPSDPARCFLKAPAAELEPVLDKYVHSKALRKALLLGIGLLHEGLPEEEADVVRQLFAAGTVQVLVATYRQAWGMDASAHTVVIMGTQYYHGREHRYVDYPVTDILQMMGRASKRCPGPDGSGSDAAKCVLLCHAPVKEFYKKFLYEPLPVESGLSRSLTDHFNAEIVTKTIENKQDAVDYLTWTFFYRRLTQNPNYYNLTGTTHRHLSDYLSELVEQTLGDLEQAKCASIEAEMDVVPMNVGIIAAYYYIRYTTVELFSSSLGERTKLSGLLDILCSAAEYDTLPIRHHEEALLRKHALHLPIKIEKPAFKDPHVKANVLFQAHFSRRAMTPDLTADQTFLLERALRLLQALVDVIASASWLAPALAAMELAQMVTQAVWDSDSPLRQLPHFGDELLHRCADAKVESVFDLVDMDEKQRRELLAPLSDSEFRDVAAACNRYPNVDVTYEEPKSVVQPSASVTVPVVLEREGGDNAPAAAPLVHAPYFPKDKQEGWWLVVGDPQRNQLLAIKRLTLARRGKYALEFTAPATEGTHELMLYFMSDAYLGCDQEYKFVLHVAKAGSENQQTEPTPMETDAK